MLLLALDSRIESSLCTLSTTAQTKSNSSAFFSGLLPMIKNEPWLPNAYSSSTALYAQHFHAQVAAQQQQQQLTAGSYDPDSGGSVGSSHAGSGGGDGAR